MEFIDTHVHLYDKEFNEDLEYVIANSNEANVSKLLMPCVDISSIDSMLEIAYKYSQLCFPMIGLHPCYVDNTYQRKMYKIEEYLDNDAFIAIGEVGLDFYRDDTYKNQQIDAFSIQLELALKYDLPIVIHSRNAFKETLEVISNYSNPKNNLSGVFHCFSGSLEEANSIIALNFYLGIGGILTFSNSKLSEVVKLVDMSKIVLETDSPYLAPSPHRGKRNEPSFITYVADKLSSVKNIPIEEVSLVTSQNARGLFKLIN